MQENQQAQNQLPAERGNGKSRRGFASMDKDRHKLVSSKGGKSERRQFINPVNSARTSYEGF
jgi:hypothetical protein